MRPRPASRHAHDAQVDGRAHLHQNDGARHTRVKALALQRMGYAQDAQSVVVGRDISLGEIACRSVVQEALPEHLETVSYVQDLGPRNRADTQTWLLARRRR